MNTLIKNKKALLWIVSIAAIAVVIYLGWADFLEGFKDGYNNRAK